MKCPKCRFDNPDDTSYCGRCAASLHRDTLGAAARESYGTFLRLWEAADPGLVEVNDARRRAAALP